MGSLFQSVAWLLVIFICTYVGAGVYASKLTASQRLFPQASELPTVTVTVNVTADTAISASRQDQSAGADKSLNVGQQGGYAADTHLLVRFDDLPKLPSRDLVRVRLGLFRQTRDNANDDHDTIVKRVLPALKPFGEMKETWQTAAQHLAPNNTMRDYEQPGRPDMPQSWITLSINSQPVGEYKYADVTDIVRDWLEGRRPNLGFLLITDFARSQPHDGTAWVSSREAPEGQRPLLELTYMQRPAHMPDGRWVIVEPDSATEAERTAATELRNYLCRICGEWFEILTERSYNGKRPAVWVGATDFARKQRVYPDALEREAFVMRKVGQGLILCGGSPRGTFYAVAQFLEEYCGVRWLTLAGDEYVPQRTDLKLPRVNRTVRPAFVDRDLLVPYNWPREGWYSAETLMQLNRALAFGRINGRATSVYLGIDAPSESYGGCLHGNHLGHTIRWYLPPERYFETHPEFYALRDGKRSPTGLCKTNPAMRELYYKNISPTIQAGAAGTSDTYLFHISDEDGPPQVCGCPDCRQADGLFGGSPMGQMLDFLNYLIIRGRTEWPANARLETLAYAGHEVPPPSGTIDRDVVIRFAPIHKRHWDRLESPLNKRDLENLRGWLRIAKDVRVYDYPHQWGSGAEPVSSLIVSRPSEPGLREWVQRAVSDPMTARAGLHLSLSNTVSATERHVFAAHITAFEEIERSVRPRLFVWWKRPNDQRTRLTVLQDAAAAIVNSELPDTVIGGTWEPGVERAGGIALRGHWAQTEGPREYSYLRFNFGMLPKNARIVDAELVLSRLWVRGGSGAGRVEIRGVQRAANWDPIKVTWASKPPVDPEVLFTLDLPLTVPGYAGHDALFPQPNLKALVDNIRLYGKLGVKGVYLQTDSPGLYTGMHCEADMTYWVLMQSLWNPRRSADELIRDFCLHYYGPAAEPIARYVALLENAYRLDPHHQAFHVGNYALQNFVNLDVITAAQGLFDQAESACGLDQVLLKRVRRARLSLDLLTLFNLQRLSEAYLQRYSSLDGFPFNREAIETRYTVARLESVAQRYPERNLDAEREAITRLLSDARNAGVWTVWRTVPPPPAGK